MEDHKHKLDKLIQVLSENNKQDNKEIWLAIEQQRMLLKHIQSQLIQLQARPKEKSATRIMVEHILMAVSMLDLTSVVTEELAREKFVPNTRDCVRIIREKIDRFKINLPDRSDEDTPEYEKYVLATTTTTTPPDPSQELVLNVV